MLEGRGWWNWPVDAEALVREPSGAAFSDFVVSLIRQAQGLFDLIELRIALETMSARAAAKRASRAALQALEATMQGMREAAEGVQCGDCRGHRRDPRSPVPRFRPAVPRGAGDGERQPGARLPVRGHEHVAARGFR